MSPSLRVCGLEDIVIDPLDETEPQKLSLVWARFAVGGQSGNKAGTSLIEDRSHFGRYTTLKLDDQTNPICEGEPLNELRHGGGKPSGINELKLRLGLVARPGPESNLSFAVSSGHKQRRSSSGTR
jgi:hypothetical protein